MFNISSATADSIYNYSNIALIFGTTIALIATIAAIYSSSIREQYSNERTATNERLTIVAKAEAAKATENAAIANKIASEANESAAKSNLRAIEVEKQNIELRIKFSSRHIDKKQYDILVSILSKNPSTFNIETMGDPESGMYAADILKTFLDSGWNVDKKEFPLGVIWTGIQIFQTNDPAALYIADALKAAKIKFNIGNEFREKATIMIGGKPQVY
ncbi:hypothetical protein [Flavobacterium sp. CAN_S2]|uniref:hypothetical protein n=1 Tax=Flavobacterium sp. CAN_S2 TaxID=2787726 RepID=UPI0018CB4C66